MALPYSGLSGQTAPGTIQPPDDYQRVQATPEAFGAGVAQATGQFGGAVQRVGGEAINIAIQQRQLQDARQSTDAHSALRNQATITSYGDPNDPNSRGYLTSSGQDAVTSYSGAIKSLQDTQSTIRASLSPTAQLAFDKSSSAMLDATVATYAQHRATQMVVSANQSNDASARTAQSAAIASAGDEEGFLHNLADGRNDIITKGSRLGWTPDIIKNQVDSYVSQARVGATERLAATNPQQAWAYYQQHQKELVGSDQLAVESKLKPALLQWGARDAANNILAGSSGPMGPVAPVIMQEAQKQGVSSSLALTSAKIESGIGTVADRPGSQFQGIYQMGDGAWAARGGTAANRSDPQAQVQLGIANLAHSRDVAAIALGTSPADWQSYLVHQQGDGGGAALLAADPKADAASALAVAYNGNQAKARQAIMANGGKAGMSVGDFLSLWQNKYTAAESTVSKAATGLANYRPNLPAMMDTASKVIDPFGQSNPQFQDAVQSRIRAKVSEQEYAQREAEKSNRETLLGAAMGLPAANGTSSGTTPSIAAGVPGADPSASAPGVAPPPTAAPGQPAPVPARPTNLDQLFTNPAAKAAWTSATPETQRSIMALLDHNAQGHDPPVTPQSQSLYYQLSGMAVNDREQFQGLDLSDPKYTGALPHGFWNALAAEQHRFGKSDVAAAGREASQARALTVLRPDLLAAGIKTDGLKPGSAAATTYDTFVGRLRESLDTFQQENKRRPNDQEIAKIGNGLLMQGTQRGTAGILPSFLGGGDKSVRAFQTEPGQFAPTVPDADRKSIVAAYQARHGGTAPTAGQVQEIWMVGRQQANAPRQVRPQARQPAQAGPSTSASPSTPTLSPLPSPNALPSSSPAASVASALPAAPEDMGGSTATD